jgi:hypothetical protein
MRRFVFLAIVLVVVVALLALHGDTGSAVQNDIQATKYGQPSHSEKTAFPGSFPLAFTANEGQFDDAVLFRADAGRATVWLTRQAVCFHFVRRIQTSNLDEFDYAFSERSGVDENVREEVEHLVIKTTLVGANPDPIVASGEMLEYKCNYFLGNDPRRWHTHVANYSFVTYEDMYPGIDLRYYGGNQILEYDFIVSPEADYSQIEISYVGVNSIAVNDAGELLIETDWGTVTEHRPVIYQQDGELRIEIEGRFRIISGNTFGFTVGDRYNPDIPLVIDPVLTYSTFLCGSSYDYGFGISVDDNGDAYMAGKTHSTDYPVVNPYQPDPAVIDVVITKIDAEGGSLIYSTFLGGVGSDVAYDIEVDGEGNAYITGQAGPDFPTVNAYQPESNSNDVFIAKLSSEGDELLYSTYLGGSDWDEGYAIAIDADGSAYVTGVAVSSDFPTVNPIQTDQGYYDAFVCKLGTAGDSLVYSTYLGGSYTDRGHDIAVDGEGCAYVTGLTESSDFPTVNPIQADVPSSGDIFVTKLNPQGTEFVYSTYLGGDGWERGRSIAVDGDGNAYVTGLTESTDFPLVNPYQTYQGKYDIFVTKFNQMGDELLYSTYIGADSSEFTWAIDLDDAGNAYLAGFTVSANFPVKQSIHPYRGEIDIVVVKLNDLGNDLIFGTFLGGEGADYVRDIEVGSNGDIYLSGYTFSSDFPTMLPYQQGLLGNASAVVVILSEQDYTCGDADLSGLVDIDDVVYLLAYIFSGGQPPWPQYVGDADCNGAVDIDDVIYLITYIFVSGQVPGYGCCGV